MTEQLHAVLCHQCGRPTGEFLRAGMVSAEPTCPTCRALPVRPDRAHTAGGQAGPYACVHCGGEAFSVVEVVRRWSPGTIERLEGEDGLFGRIQSGYGDEDVQERDWRCNDCDRHAPVADFEWE